MNWCELIVNFSLNLLSGVIGILIVLWIERQRLPSLSMTLGSKHQIKEGDFLDRPPSSWLRVLVHNRNMPRWLAWVYHGEPALACRAWISFHYLDGKRVSDQQMEARWSGSPEPKVETITVENKGQIRRLVGEENSFDIAPGEDTLLDVAIRDKSNEDSFGWNNESYLFEWRHARYHIGGKGRYIALIKIKTGGQEYKDVFMIVNDEGYENFRLEPVDEEIRKLLL